MPRKLLQSDPFSSNGSYRVNYCWMYIALKASSECLFRVNQFYLLVYEKTELFDGSGDSTKTRVHQRDFFCLAHVFRSYFVECGRFVRKLFQVRPVSSKWGLQAVRKWARVNRLTTLNLRKVINMRRGGSFNLVWLYNMHCLKPQRKHSAGVIAQ